MVSSAPPTDAFIRRCRLIKIVDGDTLRLEIDCGFGARITHDIRLTGVDTPEARGVESHAGLWVTKQVEQWIGDERDCLIHSARFTLGKWGRCLCRVWFDEWCLNNRLLDSGFGWPTDADGRIIGPRSLDRLVLPDAIRRKCLEGMT